MRWTMKPKDIYLQAVRYIMLQLEGYIMLQPKDIGCCGCNINSRNSSANRQYSISMYGKRRDYNQ